MLSLVGAKRLRQLVAVHPWHADVEKRYMWTKLSRRFESTDAIASNPRLMAIERQAECKAVSCVQVVVDDEDSQKSCRY